MSMRSDIQGKCCSCGKDYGKTNIEFQCYFLFVLCAGLFMLCKLKMMGVFQ